MENSLSVRWLVDGAAGCAAEILLCMLLITEFIDEDSTFCLTRAITGNMIMWFLNTSKILNNKTKVLNSELNSKP